MPRTLLALAALLALAPSSVQAQTPAPFPSGTFAIENVRVFDGRDVHERVTVLVRNGRVAAMGRDVALPTGVPVVDGDGRTLLPGLIDAHTHTFDGSVLQQALALGVTLHLDMFTVPALIQGWRSEQEAGGARNRADVLGPGYLATAEGGHGTQYGFPVPTVDRPEDAQPWVDARVEEGADFIKIVLEDGSAYGFTSPTLDDDTFRALVRAAHARGLLAVVHVSTLAKAELALDAGADGLVHLWDDTPPDATFARRMAEAGTFIVPTLPVLEGMVDDALDGGASASILNDSELAAFLDAGARQTLLQRFPLGGAMGWAGISQSIRTLHEAGVVILTGSDAPNPGTAFGASIHRDVELLVHAGLTPVEALRAATSNAAESFRLEGHGRIALGGPANLLLVDGDPTRSIRDTRRIVSVWKDGDAFNRDALRSRIAGARAVTERATTDLGSEPIVIGDFEDGSLAAPMGSPWTESTDAMAGGNSTVTLEVVEGGAEGSARALRLSGEVRPAGPFGWATAMYFPSTQPFLPVNLSATEGFAFHVRGSGPGFNVSVFSGGGNMIPVSAGVEVPGDPDSWTCHFLRWSDLPGVMPEEVTALSIGAGPAAGTFEYFLDRVTLIPQGGEGCG